MKMSKKFMIKQLTLAQDEVNKRLDIQKSQGVDLIEYENNFYTIFVNLIVENFRGTFKDKEIRDEIDTWLWERNYTIWYKEKPDWIKSKWNETEDDLKNKIKGWKIKLKKPKDFYEYLKTL